jgi:hypothetical protein
MNARQCIFGVPADFEIFDLCDIIADTMYVYDCSDFSSLFIACNDEQEALEYGMRLFVIGSTDREWFLDREEFVDAFSLNQDVPLMTLLHDDVDRIYVFEQTHEGESIKFLMSNGPYLSGDIDSIDIEYSQKGFSNRELNSFYEKSQRELTGEEQRAIFDFDNAIDIAFRQWHPAIDFPDHLNLFHSTETYAVIGARIGSQIRRPKIWYNTFHYAPNDSDWSRSDLSNPYYDVYEEYDDIYEEFESF